MATLLEILARDIASWPKGVGSVHQYVDGQVWALLGGDVFIGVFEIAEDRNGAQVNKTDWLAASAERLEQQAKAMLTATKQTIAPTAGTSSYSHTNTTEAPSQQAQGAISYEQRLWDEVAKDAYSAYLQRSETASYAVLELKSRGACDAAAAFMAERAKRMQSKPSTTDLLAALEEAAHALNRWGPAAGERYLRMVEEAKEGGAA